MGSVLAKSFFLAHSFLDISMMSITLSSFFSSILIYFFNRFAMVANMVPREAALVPMLSHSVRPMPRR